MSGPVIIRLQNLPLEARSIDIRRFFEGLLIPDGGVHIIGGERGDAFIAFQSDEDARQAMSRDNCLLCNAHIKLYLSSKTEMQNVIAAARNHQMPAPVVKSALSPPAASFNEPNMFKANSMPQLLNQTPMAKDPMDLISSLTKFMSNNNNNNVVNKSSYSQAPKANLFDHLENLNGLFPQAAHTSNGLAAAIDSTASSMYQKATAATLEQPKPNISIDQILSILQNHIQPATGATAQPPVTAPTNTALTTMLDSAKYDSNSDLKNAENDQNNVYSKQNRFNNKNNVDKNFNQSRPSYAQEENNNGYNKFANNNNNNFNNNNSKNFQEPFNGQPPKFNNFNNNYNNNNKFNNRNNSKHTRYGECDAEEGNGEAVMPKPPGRQMLDPIIRVKNFNTNCSYKDVRTFLQGIQIEHDGIKLLTEPATGQRNGMAFVKLLTITDLKKALCRNGQFYEDNSIVVTQSSEAEFNGPHSFYVFSNANNKNNNQQNKNFNNNNNNNNNNQRFNNPVEVNKKFNNNINSESPQHQQESQPLSVVPSPDESGFYLKIYGLPANFYEGALKSMFNNVKFLRIVTSTPTPITSTNNNNGSTEQTTTLKAKKLCQVETQLDLERALTRQDERVGKSKLQIFQISKTEYERELANLNKSNFHNNYSSSNNNNHNNYNESNESNHNDAFYIPDGVQQQQDSPPETSYCDNIPSCDDLFIYMSGVSFSVQDYDVKAYFQDVKAHVVGTVLLHDAQTHKRTGECICYFLNKSQRDRALEKDDHLFRNRVIKIKPITSAEYQQLAWKEQQLKLDQSRFFNKRKAPLLPSNNGLMSMSPSRNILLQTPTSPDERPKLLDQNSLNSNDEIDAYEYEQQNQNCRSNSSVNSNEDCEQFEDDSESKRMNRNRNAPPSYNNNNNNNNKNVQQRNFKNNNNNFMDNNSNNFKGNRMNLMNINNPVHNNNNNNMYQSNNNGVKRRAMNNGPGVQSNQTNHSGNKRIRPNYNNNNNNRYNNNYNENENDFEQSNGTLPSLIENMNTPVLPPLPVELQKYRNRLVLFSNISYEASREDILELVRHFSPIEQTLKIRHDDMGQPAGDAVVALQSSEDANQACRMLNGMEFMGHSIKATLFSS